MMKVTIEFIFKLIAPDNHTKWEWLKLINASVLAMEQILLSTNWFIA